MNIHFAYPWLLALLALPIVLVWWDVRRRGTEVRLPFDYGDTTPRQRLRTLVNVAHALPAVLLAIAVVLLARPQRQVVGETVREVRQIQLLVDISDSMNANYGQGTRYQGAMAALRNFVHHRVGDAFALSAFGAEVVHWLPLTKDISGIDMAEAFLEPKRWPSSFVSGTFTGQALEAVKARLDAVPGDRTIILLTDGDANDLGPDRTNAIGRALAEDHITVFPVYIGGGIAPRDMSRLAELTGGRLFKPDNPQEINDTFRRIDAMQPSRMKPVTRTSIDAMGTMLWVSTATLGLTLLCGFGLRYTPW